VAESGTKAGLLTLRELRLANGWRQIDLARRSRVSSRTISSIETGAVKPRAPTRKKLLRALSVHWQAQSIVFGPLL
jgi:transcriptional regulator with XRE-family HTH domain